VSARVRWEAGGEATVATLAGDHVTLRSTRSFPPGAPARATLLGDAEVALTVKVAGSRREEDGSFLVRGRFVSPTVALRAALASGHPTGGESS
jgi:hypothetical protein